MALTAYVVGSPGLFNFNPFDYTSGLVSDKLSPETDFDRLDKEGWDDRNTYLSARAPLGQLLWTKTDASDIYDAYSRQAYWHLNSQDTIKIVSGAVLPDDLTKARGQRTEPVAKVKKQRKSKRAKT